MLRYPTADQLQGWLDLILGKLIHQLVVPRASRS
jgi:hypothetical protein